MSPRQSLFAVVSTLVVVAALGYPQTVLPQNDTFHQQFAMVMNPNYGLHVFARGANSSLFHKFQTGVYTDVTGTTANMSEWHCLTPNPGWTSAGRKPLIFWEDPVAEINNDGRAEIFIRLTGDLDLWQIYQTDAKDPLAWTEPRPPACLCNFPPCVDKGQTKCGVVSQCDNTGLDCDKEDPNQYWLQGSAFPTANMNMLKDPSDGRLTVYFRNFDGQIYTNSQMEPGNSTLYTSGIKNLPWHYDSTFE